MKTFLFTFFFLFSTLYFLVYTILQDPGEGPPPSSGREPAWQKVERTKQGIQTSPVSKREQQQFQLKEIAPPKAEKKRLVLNGPVPLSNTVTMVNTINPSWMQQLGRELLRFQAEDTQVFVHPLQSAITIDKGGEGRYIEIVLVTYKKTKGHNSFHASVDSSTGEILSTWNRTIHEHFKKDPVSFQVVAP